MLGETMLIVKGLESGARSETVRPGRI